MDLSTGKRIIETRQAILDAATVPIGTVPIYEAMDGLKHAEDLTTSGCSRSSTRRRSRASTT